MDKKRSIGISIIGFVKITLGLGSLIFAIREISTSVALMLGDRISDVPISIILLGMVITAVPAAIFGAIYTVSGICILKLRNWARLVSIIHDIINMGLAILFMGPLIPGIISNFLAPPEQRCRTVLALSMEAAAVAAVIMLALQICFIIYLTRPSIKSQFK